VYLRVRTAVEEIDEARRSLFTSVGDRCTGRGWLAEDIVWGGQKFE